MKKRYGGLAVVAAATALALAGCGATDPAPAGDAPELRLATHAEMQSWDPGQAVEGAYMPMYQTVYDSLLRREPDGTIVPMLAESWEFDEGRTVLTLELRDDVTFTDGEKFDAEAVKANLEHFRDGSGPQANTLAGLADVEVVADHTVALTLDGPEPEILTYLSNAAGLMGSPAAIGTEDIMTAPVGSGPYVWDASASVTGSEYAFTLNEDYWDPSLQKFSAVTFVFMSDVVTRLNALSTGQVQGALLDAQTSPQADAAGLTKTANPINWSGLVLADRAGEVVPALADVRVRQAINHAIDAEALLRELEKDNGERTTQVFGPSSSGFVADLDEAYSYDPDLARELLEDAGYADGFDVTIPSASWMSQTLTAVMRDQLGAVGIRVAYQDVTGYFDAATSRQYGLFWMSLFQPGSWATVQQEIAPDTLWNPFGTTDADVAGLIEDIRGAADADAEAEAAQALSEHLVEEAWFAPWYRLDLLYYVNADVTVQVQAEQGVPSIYNYSPAS